MITRRTILAAVLAAPMIARADEFPSRTVKLVIPWPPGASAGGAGL